MNQLITIALLFCLSYTMGLLQTPAVLQLNSKVMVTIHREHHVQYHCLQA
jgi:hypothetical protein